MFTKNNWWIIILITLYLFHFVEISELFPWIDIIPGYPDSDFAKIPKRLECVFFILTILTYIIGSIYIGLTEKDLDKSSKWHTNFSLIWIKPKILTKRYGSINYIPLLSSLFWTGILFSLAIPITSFIVFLFKAKDQTTSYTSQPLNFIHSEGILISFFVVVLYWFSRKWNLALIK